MRAMRSPFPLAPETPSPFLLSQTAFVLSVNQSRSESDSNEHQRSKSKQKPSLGHDFESRDVDRLMRRKSLNRPGQSQTHADIQNLGSHAIRYSHRSIAFSRYGVALHHIGDGRSEADEHHSDERSHTGRVQ